MQLGLALPPPFTLVPRLLVQSAAGAVMRSVTQLVVPQFVTLLEKDYARSHPNPNPRPHPHPHPSPSPNPNPNPNQVGSLMRETDVLDPSLDGVPEGQEG